MLTVSAAEGALALPYPSTAMATTALSPGCRARVSAVPARLQAPVASAVAVPSRSAPSTA